MFAFNQPLGRVIRVPLRLIPKDAAVPIISGPNRGLRWIVGSFRHACWMGIYERPCSSFIASQVRSGMTAFDVGANVGYHTLLMARRVGPSGRVFAFEPGPANVAALRRHLAINDIKNVEVIEAAVSDRSGTAFFRGTGAQSMLSDTGGVPVKTVTLDDYPMPDFVKMDIEGAELLAMEGARKILSTRGTSWLIELHGQAYEELPRSLKAQGYSVQWVTDWEIAVTA